MPKYRITGPDGKTYDVTALAGASQDEVLGYVRDRVESGQAAPKITRGRDFSRWLNNRADAMRRMDAGAKAALSGIGRNIGIPGTDIDVSHGLEALGATPYEELSRQAEEAGPLASIARGTTELGAAIPAGGGALGQLRKIGPLAKGLSSTGIGGMAARGAVEGGAGAAVLGQGNPVTDLISGAVTGGGMAAGMSALSRPLTGLSRMSDDAAELSRRGYPLTPGQAVDPSGAMGSTIRAAEEASTSAPIAGPLVQSLRGRGLEKLRETALKQALPPGMSLPRNAGVQPLKALREIGKRFSQLYDEALNAIPPGSMIRLGDTVLEPTSKVPVSYMDDVFRHSVQAGRYLGPKRGKAIQNMIDDALGFKKMNARQVFAAQNKLRTEARRFQNLRNATIEDQDTAEAYMRAADYILEDLMNGLPKGEKLNALRYPYRNYINLRHEVEKLKGFGETMTPKAVQKAAEKIGSKNLEYEARLAGSVLPSSTPDSGTAGRAAAMAMLGGAGGLIAGGDPESALKGAAIGAGAMIPSYLMTTPQAGRFLFGQYPWQQAAGRMIPRAGGILGGYLGAER